MPQAKDAWHVRNLAHQVAVIDIVGDMNSAAENRLMDAYATAVQPGVTTIVLNFEQLNYMNSSGIGLLVTLLIRAQRQKQKLIAYGLSEHYREIFALTRLDEAIQMYADEATALAAVR
jgi:anti-sigma B factor antagonist